jgi:transglutaminase-like putative cysteine protease
MATTTTPEPVTKPAARGAGPSRLRALWDGLANDDVSAHEATGRGRVALLRHPLRLIAMGITALAIAFGLTGGAGIASAIFGATLGVSVGHLLGRSKIRMLSIAGALALVLVVLWLAGRGATGSELVPSLLGPHRALSASVALRFFAALFAPVAMLRALACRRRTFLAVELFAVVASLAALFAAHRGGILSRPFWLSDWAWRAGLDPADVLLAIGGAAVVLLTLLMVAETGHRITAMSAVALPLLALLCVTIFDLAGLPRPQADNNLGLTGAASSEAHEPPRGNPMPSSGVPVRPEGSGRGEGEPIGGGGPGPSEGEQGGGGGRGQKGEPIGGGHGEGEPIGGGNGSDDRPQDGPPRPPSPDDPPPSSPQAKAAPMAVVLLGDDYAPPAQTFYFRQEVWSEFKGARLVAAERSGIDGDTLQEFPTQETRVPDPPPENGRQLVHATVVLVVEHTRPFALETARSFEPADNPEPERFVRAYRTESLAQSIDYKSLIGLSAGNPKWSKEVLAHYTRPASDPRFAALAQEIVATLPPEKRKDPFLQALTIKLWMDQNLIYSTKERHAKVADPTADFLFGNRTGYCVHFAHAAAFLWRALGIPARVSTGYAVPEDNREGSTIMIQGGEAHAWPELYLDTVGWVVLDISAHQNLDPPAQPADKELQKQLAEMARKKPPKGHEEAEDVERPTARLALPSVWRVLAVVFLSTLALLYAIKIWRRLAPRFAGARSMPRVGYRCALDLLSEMGLSREYGETREAFARRVRAVAPSFEALTHMNVAARFGDPAVAISERHEHSLERWRDGLRALRGEVKNMADGRRRLVALLNPASFVASR